MADAFTPNYSLIQCQVGGDSGTWGTLMNAGDFGALDNILGATYSTSITSADVTLTTSQFQNGIFLVTGTATGNHALILPFQTVATTVACGGKFVVVNNQAGAFNLSVKTGTTGLSATVPQGFAASLYCDGTNVSYATNNLPGFAAASNGNPNGQLAGTAGSVNTNPSLAYDYANNIFYLCTASGTAGSAVWAQPSVVVPRGFDTAVNLSFTTSVSANVLTVTALAANTGTTPTVANPIIIPFRDVSLPNGDPVQVNVTTALSISTFTTGASLGATSGVPFRLWIVAFNNAGTPVLGLVNCSNSTRIAPLNEASLQSATGMSAGATSVGTIYAPNGVTINNRPARIVGFLSYETPLVTAGTYNNLPDVVQLFGPGIKKPGDTVQGPIFASAIASTSCNTTATITALTQAVQPTSTINPIHARAEVCFLQGGSAQGTLQMGRISSTNLFGTSAVLNSGTGANLTAAVPLAGTDGPATTASITYAVYGKCTVPAGLIVNDQPGSQSTLTLWEIMG